MFRSFFTTLKSKILTGYVIVIAIMIFVMVWSLYNFNRLNESFRSIIVQNYSSIVAADNMVRSLDSQLNAIVLLLNKENTATGKQMFENSKQDFFYWFESARASAFTPKEFSLLDSLNDQYQSFLIGVDSLLNDNKIETRITRQTEYLHAIRSISSIKNFCYSLFEINHAVINQSNDNINNITNTAAYTMLFLIILGTVVSLIISSKFSQFIVKPVLELTRSVKHISAGHFDQVIKSEDSDEIGILADEFNSMVGRLKRYEKLNINKILYEKRKSDVIVESINDPVLMVNENLEIIQANQAYNDEFSKIKADKVVNLNDAISDKGLCKSIKQFILTESQNDKEEVFQLRNINGEQKYFRLRYSSIYLPENELKAALVVFSDITKYEELDRLKSEFIAKVSHELKTPLTSIGMAVGILGEGIAGELTEKQEDLLSSMKEDYDRLNKLVKEILELSKIESGVIQLRLEKVNINSLLDECLKSFYLQTKEKEINLNIETNENLPLIDADHDYLLRAIENFIGNSIKFTGESGEININAEVINNNIVITISDTGSGISPEYLDKIFDKFVQVSGNSRGSVGLGLSIAKEIIELHKGTIKVWSQPGEGSKFEITIPVIINE